MIGVIKSINFKKSKENYKANCFEINRKFILSHGNIYIFLITKTKKNIYAFYPRHISKDGLIILTKNNKLILIGIKGKIVSDFIDY